MRATCVGTKAGHRLRDLLAMSRPRFWLVSAVAIELGFVLATHRVLPRGHEIATVAHATLVAGPLLWLAVLSVNDAWDLDSDRANPRRANSPLVRGRITPREAIRVGAVAGLVAVLAAMPLGVLFTLGTALAVLLGWAYSMPPLRLKTRAGADVMVNAFAVGVLGPLGGWVAVTGTTDRFPWPIGTVALLAAAALYLPTTLVDHDADRDAGLRTTAVVLGRRATFELGFALWAGSAVLAFVLAATGAGRRVAFRLPVDRDRPVGGHGCAHRRRGRRARRDQTASDPVVPRVPGLAAAHQAVRADQPDHGTPRAWHLHDGATQPHPAAAGRAGPPVTPATSCCSATDGSACSTSARWVGSTPACVPCFESLRDTATAELVKLLPLIRRTPRRLDRLITALEQGRLSTGTRVLADDRDRHFVTHLHQTLVALIATAAGIIGAILLGTAGGPRVAETLSLFQLLAYTLLIVSGALALRVLTSILRADSPGRT